MARKAISKKLRFEVFKRDSFTCQYCGKKAPDVVLEVDHIKPVVAGGDNDILNLITSCFDCNRGKSKHKLSENAEMDKKRAQLEALQERKDQIDMLMEWQENLKGLDDYELDNATKIINEMIGPRFSINQSYKNTLRKLIKKYSFEEVIESATTSRDQYLRYDNEGCLLQGSVENFLVKIAGILRNKKLFSENPEMKELYYVRGILKHRFGDYISWREMKLIEEAHSLGVDIEQMKTHAATVKNISTWRSEMMEVIDNRSNNAK